MDSKTRKSASRIAIVTAGAICTAVLAASPASADSTTDFIDSLGTAGIPSVDPGQAADLGRSVCPMLSQPGQDLADTAAKVADAGGMSLGPATMFTGLAISAFCPSAMSSLANGESPVPLGLLGGLGF
ncbi:DUF732 domain-containing protein [Mycolicibacterium sp. 050158]|uniref:DUF732 domain-containing protein n=1 Tax=Mycolicibacterium sp. 050158 TaxID=3090602 RepID=UPI00299D5BB5|nr:DUF732 domain-containing protein [Mycolicibacterium sp. 050158]MDX1891963.1 DUF732 domain-containing protein [Mycolicibacterium sp. 050158]